MSVIGADAKKHLSGHLDLKVSDETLVTSYILEVIRSSQCFYKPPLGRSIYSVPEDKPQLQKKEAESRIFLWKGLPQPS